ncbi:MAG TPA: glycosyltransferase family 39 protein, partial [Candidatus Aminicenantes bacterium]|nr:glycosyltransferase family 39 protein [Candidatus Aminicenantes bacterium]
LAVAAALLTGLILRLWGIQWGFPRVDLSPDELNVWNISARLSWSDLNTRFYNYSGLTFYLNFLGAQVARLCGVELLPSTLLLINRLWSVFFGTLTILLAFFAARDFFESRKAGAWAAWFVALLPIHVWHSHFGTSDVGLVFWVTAAFWLAVRAYRKPLLRRFLLAGLTVGIAIGVKFNGSLAGISLVVAALAARHERRIPRLSHALGLILIAGGAALVGFFLVSPFSLIHLKATVAAFFFESAHVKGGHYGFDLSPAGFPYFPYVYQLFAAFPFAFGLPLYLITLASLPYFAIRCAKGRVLLGFSFAALYLGIVCSWKFVPTRYLLPVLPILLVLSSYGVARLFVFNDSRGKKACLWSLAVVALGLTLAYDLSTVARFRRDTRLCAARWASATLPPGRRIVLVEPIFDRGYIVPHGTPGPMPFRVPLDQVMEKAYMPLFDAGRFDVLARDLRRTLTEVERRQLGRGDLLCLSSMVYLRDYRLGAKAADRVRGWNSIRKNPARFRRVKVFDAPFLGRGLFMALDPMYTADFVSPTIEFYEPLTRKAP